MAVHGLVRNVGLHAKPLGETHLQQVDVHPHESHLLAQAHERLLLVLEHVTVDARQFMDVGAGLLRALLADQAVEDIERVEQEMGVDLLFEFHVTELRLVRLTALGTQHGTRDQGVIDHKYDRIEGYLDQQGDDPQLQELPCGERAVEGERQVQPRNERHAGRREQHEQEERRDFGDQTVPGFTPARIPDIDNIDTQQDNQCRGIRSQQVGHVVKAVCGEGRR